MNQISDFHWTKVEKLVFSETLIEICEMKKGRETKKEIMIKFSLNSNANIYTSIKATMCGNTLFMYQPRDDLGGRRSFLSDVDTVLFENKISHTYFDLQ